MKRVNKAVFIGKDGSEGFKNGEEYYIRTEIRSKLFSSSGLLWVFDVNEGLVSQYSNLGAFLENWKIMEKE